MKVWTRNDTKEWIHQVENRIEDIDYHLRRTIDWCESRGVWDDKKVLILSLLTIIWVCWMREEPVSYVEVLEILGLDEKVVGDDKLYSLGEKYYNLTHEEMLEIILSDLDREDHFPS